MPKWMRRFMKRAALAAVTPLRQRSSRYSCAYAECLSESAGLRISTPSRSRSSSAARWRIFFSRPSRIGRAMPSSSTIWQARSTLMLSPSGKTMRLGAFFARCTIRLMIVYCVPPIRRCSRSRYSSMSSVSRADARLHRRLRHRRRAPPQHARVERLGDDVVGAEAEARARRTPRRRCRAPARAPARPARAPPRSSSPR